ncbi:hypothetical protein [Lentilactobacillus sp. SPB1-3]|uniref:Uncharacterized protein n=1 Tax=Lentilactobacillus terminaliae TaxID=3003483 RepID=A0ACD5DHK5_9LACO|nr:hypothetical protein [Lentilactobacillus sp. SPB1-3]MCZ0976901.1 hypothetical protein [Lentilactobacillus sp. SPB1-3]
MKSYIKQLFSVNKFVKIWLVLVLAVAILLSFKISGDSGSFSDNSGVITSDNYFSSYVIGLESALHIVVSILVPSLFLSIIPTYITSSIWIFLYGGLTMTFNFSVMFSIIWSSASNFNSFMAAIVQVIYSLVTLYFILIIFKLVALISDVFMDNLRFRTYGNLFSNWLHAIFKVVYSQRVEIVLSTVAVFLVNLYLIGGFI